jgi:hypothetical protein
MAPQRSYGAATRRSESHFASLAITPKSGAPLPRRFACSAPKQMETSCGRLTTVQRRERHGNSSTEGRTSDQGHCPPVRTQDPTRGREPKQECNTDGKDQPDQNSLTHGHEYRPLDCRIASSAPKISSSILRSLGGVLLMLGAYRQHGERRR